MQVILTGPSTVQPSLGGLEEEETELEEGEFIPDKATLARCCRIPEDQLEFDFEKDILEDAGDDKQEQIEIPEDTEYGGIVLED